jgi:hypothetical protein
MLFTRKSNRWVMLWYKSGVETSHCRKLVLPVSREILVCAGRYGGQGTEWTELWVEDLRRPVPNMMAKVDGFFLPQNDGSYPCHGRTPCPSTKAKILITVTAVFGRKTLRPEEKPTTPPPTKTYRIQFYYDAGNYIPTPQSRDAYRLFAIPPARIY